MGRFSYTKPGGMYSERRGSTKKTSTKKTTTKKSTVKKSTPKKKSFFSSFFNPKPRSIDEGYAQYTGMQIAAGGGPPGSEKFTASKKSTFGLKQAKDDFLMDIGVKKRGIDYYARLDDRKKRSQEAMKKMQERIRKGDGKPRGKSAAQIAAEKAAQEKQDRLINLRAEGIKRRRKFEREGGERIARIRAKLLNLA